MILQILVKQGETVTANVSSKAKAASDGRSLLSVMHRGLATNTVSTFFQLNFCASTGGNTCVVDSDIDFTSTITISSGTTSIIGSNSVTLSGQGSRQLFDIRNSGTKVTFSGLTLKSGSVSTSGCSSPYNTCLGGCVFAYNSADVTFTSCTFQDCTAYRGGGISAYQARIAVDSCTLTDCSAEYGGGISAWTSSEVTVKLSTFTSCSASFGGAVVAQSSSNVTLQASPFTSSS